MRAEIDILIIGAGQAGLAAGYYLKQANKSFLILSKEKSIGDVWRNRYDSLVLFTPRWYSALPGLRLEGEPNGFATKNEIADYLARYAIHFDLPVQLNTEIRSMTKEKDFFIVRTNAMEFIAKKVIIATGPFQKPFIPDIASKVPHDMYQIHTADYKKPSDLKKGPVLVVGAGNSGAQIAVIDDFIVAGMSPRFEDMPYDFTDMVQRLRDGETNVKFSNELNKPVLEVAAMFDEYRKRVAEMAIKWNDWRQGKIKGEPAAQQPEQQSQTEEVEAPDSQGEADSSDSSPPSEEVSFESDGPSDESAGDAKSDPAQSGVTDTEDKQEITAVDVDADILEAYILEHKPQFDDVELDFPELLRQRKEDKKTWMNIATSLNISSGKFSAAWKSYKDLDAKKMKAEGAA